MATGRLRTSRQPRLIVENFSYRLAGQPSLQLFTCRDTLYEMPVEVEKRHASAKCVQAGLVHVLDHSNPQRPFRWNSSAHF